MMPRRRQRPAGVGKSFIFGTRSRPRFPVLSLPAEVRIRIYEHFFDAAGLPSHTSPETNPDIQQVAPAGDIRTGKSQATRLLFTSRQVHSEAYPVFCQKVVFKFTDAADFANFFLRRLPPTNLKHIQHIRLELGQQEHGASTFRRLEQMFSVYPELEALQSFTLTLWAYADLFAPLTSLGPSSDEVSEWFLNSRNQWCSVWASDQTARRAINVAKTLVRRKGRLRHFRITTTIRQPRRDIVTFKVALLRP
jgi:hypothetical protein